MSELVNLAHEVARTNDSSTNLKLIAILRLAIYIKFRKYLNSAQVLSVLSAFCYPKALAQIKTGQGKTFIATLLAFVLSMRNKTGQIISSDRELASRDQMALYDFFKIFGVHTSHICENNPKPMKFQGKILYGTGNDFKFAIMRERLCFTSLFPEKRVPGEKRQFDYVIIDESDNLTIDTSENDARIGYPMENLNDWVYPPIFLFVKERISKDEEDKLSLAATLQDLKEYLSQYLGGKFAARTLQIPEKNLKKWLKSAHTALYLREEKNHYVIGKIKESEKKGILIVDADNTGRIMHGCRWSDGIHEFVEVKHGFQPETEILTPISLSNAVFYTHYQTIYGFSGTLGSRYDREEIKEIYGLESFDIPTYQPPRRIDLPTIIVATREEYWAAVLNEIDEIRRAGRPILVLCQTIWVTEEIDARLRARGIICGLINEIQNTPEKEILACAGDPASVTIATNTAGRGTDVILNGESKENGGLHSLLTFHPETLRVEYQNRGRAGRQDDPGSSRIIICLEDLKITGIEQIPLNRIEFILNERRELASCAMKEYHLALARLNRFCNTFDDHFFSALEKFHACLNNDKLLNYYIESLSGRKLQAAREINPGLMDLVEQGLAKEALKLLTSKDNESARWKILLKQAGEKIINKSLTAWSLQFRQQAEEMIKEVNLRADVYRREHLNQLFRNIQTDPTLPPWEQDFIRSLRDNLLRHQNRGLENLQNGIQALYDAQKSSWKNTSTHPEAASFNIFATSPELPSKGFRRRDMRGFLFNHWVRAAILQFDCNLKN